jgi:hypothetical protein
MFNIFKKEISIKMFYLMSFEFMKKDLNKLLPILERNSNFTKINNLYVSCFQLSLFNYSAYLKFSKTDPNWVMVATDASKAEMINATSLLNIDKNIIVSKLNDFDEFFSGREFEDIGAIMTLDHWICDHGRLTVGPEMDYFKHMELAGYINSTILKLMTEFGNYKIPRKT